MAKNNTSRSIGFGDKLGYAMGDAGGILTFALVSSFLQMFYTKCLHIPLEQTAMLMLVARIWDALNDPLWGAFIDSRKPTKYGRFRPYIFFFSIPLAICAVLMFTKIPGLSTSQYLIFAYITYIFYGMMYTCVNIPYGSLASVITDNEFERSSLSMWRSIGAGVGGLPAQILLPLFVYTTVEATGEKELDPSKLGIAVAILAAVSIVIFILHFKLTKERVTITKMQAESKYSMRRAIGTLIKNKPFIVLCLVSMLLICFQMYTQTTYNFLLTDYYKKPGLYSLITVFTYLPMAIFIPFVGKLIRKFGKKEICAFGILFAVAANIVMCLLKFTPLVSNPYVFLVLVFFSGAGQTFLVLEIWALVMDVIDYHELLSGRREEGTSYAFYSFVRKLGQTVAGSGASLALLAIGYDEKLSGAEQAPAVLAKLYDIATIIPAVLLIAIFILLFFCYRLSKSKLEELHAQLALQRENAKKD